MDEQPTSVERWKTSMDVSWQFDYAVEIEKLRSLYSKSKRLQWDAEREIDWTRPIDPSKPIGDQGRFGFDRHVEVLNATSASLRSSIPSPLR